MGPGLKTGFVVGPRNSKDGGTLQRNKGDFSEKLKDLYKKLNKIIILEVFSSHIPYMIGYDNILWRPHEPPFQNPRGES